MFFSLSLLGVAIICSLLILIHMLIFAQSSLYVAKVISPPFPMSQSDPKLIPNPATLTRKSSVLMHAHTHGVFLFHLPALAPPIIQTHTHATHFQVYPSVYLCTASLYTFSWFAHILAFLIPVMLISSQCGGIFANSYGDEISPFVHTK